MSDIALTASPPRFDTVRPFLHLDGAAALVLGVVAYDWLGYSWWLFAATILLPDLGILGYLRDSRFGALTYNAVHTYAAPALLAVAGWLFDAPVCLALAAIWTAHIGTDRLLGYGLKRATGFKDTHIAHAG